MVDILERDYISRAKQETA